MSKIEKVGFGLMIGAVVPVTLFLAGWWVSIGRVEDRHIFIVGLAGLVFGIITDILFLRKWIANPYAIGVRTAEVIYIFYSVCMFSFFMGVPVFNLFAGIMFGAFIGRKLKACNTDKEQSEKDIRNISRFTSYTMIFISLASAFFALKDPLDTASNLQGMLNISAFAITTPMLICVIVFGGTALVLSQCWLTAKAARVTYICKKM